MAYQNECNDGALKSAKAYFMHQGVITDPERPLRQTAAMETLNLCTDLAKRASDLADYVNGRLQPVMLHCPVANKEHGPETTKEYPPLFNDIRAGLKTISSALDSIQESLDRTEL